MSGYDFRPPSSFPSRVVKGMRAAGRMGVLHLDVKPGNVLLGLDGRVQLALLAREKGIA